MLRLTVRSGRDGRLLARLIDRDGVMFVLDYGDPSLLSDASRKVLHGGFAVSWQGVNETAIPHNPALLRQLALFYASQGLLVCVDEPDWPRIARKAVAEPPAWGDGPPTLLPDDAPDIDPSTRLMSRKDLLALRDKLERLDERAEARRAASSVIPGAEGLGTAFGDLISDVHDDLSDADLETEEVRRRKPRPASYRPPK